MNRPLNISELELCGAVVLEINAQSPISSRACARLQAHTMEERDSA